MVNGNHQGTNSKFVKNLSESYLSLRSKCYRDAFDIDICTDPDIHDPLSCHLVIESNKEIIGGARLTARDSIILPLEQQCQNFAEIYDVSILHEIGFGEISRAFIRGTNRKLDLFKTIYTIMNEKRKEYNLHCLFTLQVYPLARLTSLICSSLGYSTMVHRNVKIHQKSPYYHIGEFCIVEITNDSDDIWKEKPQILTNALRHPRNAIELH